jgi:hypothetical protein
MNSVLSIYSTAFCWTLADFSFPLFFTHLVGLLGQGTSQSKGRDLHTVQHKYRIHAQKHPYLKWDSNPQSQCLSKRRQLLL